MNVFSNPIAQLNKTEPIEIDNKQNQVEYGDVFFTTSSETPNEVGMSSVWLENKGNIYLNSFCFGFRPYIKNDPYYMAYMFRANNFRKSMTLLAQGISRYNISKTGVMNIDIQLPNNQEQERIGKLFYEIDNLITLHQRKQNDIFAHRQGLELYFFKFIKNVWEQRKLEGIVDFYRGHGLSWNDINEDGVNKCILYGNLYTDYGMVINEVLRTTNCNKMDYFLSEVGDVLIPSSDTTPTGLARASSLNLKGIILGGDINVLRPKTVNGTFLSYLINNNKNELIKRIKGTTVRHLNNSDIKDMDLYISNNLNEQVKIANLLTNLDNLITLHQRKYYYFFYSWEQRKLENIFNYERPDKYIVSSTEYLEFGPTPVLTANKAFILGYTTEKNKYVNSKESIIFDDFTLDTKFVDFPYMVKSSAIKILTLKDVTKDNIRFNFELLSNHKFNMLGHARHYISVVQPEEVFTPNKQEQDKIGELFSNLDNLITLHQHKELKRRNDNNEHLRW